MLNQRPYYCGNCPNYYDMGDGHSLRPDIENDHRRGQCRALPPVAGQDWPQIRFTYFCGVHPSAPMNRGEQLLAQVARAIGEMRDPKLAQSPISS